jgi:hypothetical protein
VFNTGGAALASVALYNSVFEERFLSGSAESRSAFFHFFRIPTYKNSVSGLHDSSETLYSPLRYTQPRPSPQPN